MPDRKTVMISSTARDLPEHRKRVMDACLRQEMFPLMMEHLPASDADAIEVSLKMVEEADIYLGIYGHRYGYVPEGHDVSITEMEYSRATELGKPRLLFMMHGDHTVRDEDIDRGDKALKLATFKERVLKERVVNFFKSPSDLRALAIDSLSDYRVGDVPTRAAAYRLGRDYRNRQAMLERVRHAWIEGVLEKSLYYEARIELGLKEQPEAVERPWAMFVQEQGRPAQELPRGARMSEVFDELGGALLILGAPGTGKTTLLLELASDLLDRAARYPEHPIPVVFHLSSWAARRRPLAEWMAAELRDRYSVTKAVARAWVGQEAILPLLDGLDEVAEEHRAACVKAINGYRQEHGLVSMAVCCRSKEFESLGVRLRLQGAVAIESLSPEQVDVYLQRAGAALAEVSQALARDRTLYDLLDTPLALSVAALAYRERAASGLEAPGTVEERRGRLFGMYVEAMYERRRAEARYVREHTDRWLAWLAGRMNGHNQSVFLLERMQPDWLPTAAQRWMVVRGLAIVIWLVGGLVGGLAGSLVHGMVVNQGGGLVIGLLYGLVPGLIPGLVGRSREPTETLRWSWSAARRGLFVGLAVGLVTILLLGEVGMLFVGVVEDELFLDLFLELVNALLFLGPVVGLSLGLMGGGIAYLRHLMLRALLARNHLAPWKYAAFLDYATERIFLRKVGGGYIFIHRLLQDYFAELWEREYGGAE